MRETLGLVFLSVWESFEHGELIRLLTFFKRLVFLKIIIQNVCLILILNANYAAFTSHRKMFPGSLRDIMHVSGRNPGNRANFVV